jgi:hypothetical protein
VEESQCQRNGSGHDPVADNGIFDGSVGPHGKASEVNQERHDIDFESPADGEEHVEKADEHKGCPDHQSDDVHLLVASAVLSPRSGRVGRMALRRIVRRRKIGRRHGLYLEMLAEREGLSLIG